MQGKLFVNAIVLREAKASTEIENIFTTDDELYKSLIYAEHDLSSNAKEVLFYRQAFWAGYQRLKEAGAFDKDLIVEIYQKIKQVNDGIRPSQTETVIKKQGSGLLGGSVIYTLPISRWKWSCRQDNKHSLFDSKTTLRLTDFIFKCFYNT